MSTEQPIETQSEKKSKNTYKSLKLLGTGSFGKAYLVECSDKVKLIYLYVIQS